MKTTGSQKLKIGLFTFIGIVVLALIIFFIGNKRNLFSSTFQVYGTFKNVNGLNVGNNVRFAGINVGVVEAITIENDTTVRIDLTLSTTVKKFIKQDSKLAIGSDGLVGDKLITITPGGVSTTKLVADGGQLQSVPPFDSDKLIAKLTGIADNAGILIQNLASITGKVNSGHGSLGKLLNDDNIANNLNATVKQARSTMDNVHQTTTTLNQDLTAAQHNFLLKGFFNKKKKAAKARQDSIKKAEEASSQAPASK